MYKILVTEPAQKDLKQAVSYISNELKNPTAAINLLNEFEIQVSKLADMPNRYKIIDDEYLVSKSIRALKIKNYIAFYIVHNDTNTVSVIRFLYNRRDWSNILK